MELHYLPGSPYARIARVLALEFGISCFIEWTQARLAIPWRGRANLEAIVAHTGARESFSKTAPGPGPL